MTDLRTTIIPKSDQLNADDLIGGRTMTIKVTKVSLAAGDQPVVIHYEGDNGHPYKPGKSMRRVLVHCWGPDGNAFIGRSMTLYCDEKVQFGGLAVGGIRISHMSHIDAPITMALTATRGSKKAFTVKPLNLQQVRNESGPAKLTREQQSTIVEAAKKSGITSADVYARFNVDRLSNILSSGFAEVLAWVESQGQSGDLCPECLTEGGHSASCPRAEPPDED